MKLRKQLESRDEEGDVTPLEPCCPLVTDGFKRLHTLPAVANTDGDDGGAAEDPPINGSEGIDAAAIKLLLYVDDTGC